MTDISDADIPADSDPEIDWDCPQAPVCYQPELCGLSGPCWSDTPDIDHPEVRRMRAVADGVTYAEEAARTGVVPPAPR